TSTVVPSFPLLADAALLNLGSTVTNARIARMPSVQNVGWTSLVNVTATSNSIQKTAGCDGCEDAGAVSIQKIASGDGYVKFTATETNTQRYAGLSHGSATTTVNELVFGLALRAGYAEVRESDVYRADVPYVAGDVFRISVES